MAGSEEIWRAVVDFCEEVMLQKETAGRIPHQEAALSAPAGAAAAAAVATATRRRRGRRRTAGGAPTPLPPSGPTCSKKQKAGDTREVYLISHTGEIRLRGRYTITWGLPSLEYLPLAQVPTHGMARNWVGISPSLSSRRHIGVERSEGAEVPSGSDKKGRCKKQGGNLPPPV